MITTLSQAKLMLGTPDGDDLKVDALIPLVENDYLRIRNKPFETGNILTITAPATAAGNVTITIDGNDTETAVLAGDSIFTVAQKILTSHRRSFSYKAEPDGSAVRFLAQEPIALTFNGAGTGVTATVSGWTTIYPTGAEYTAIKMIGYHLEAGTGGAKTSESLGDYSVSYAPGRVSGYPDTITGSIKRFVDFA